MSSPSEFSDRRFVAGTIVGLRSFSTDTLGRLTGVVVPQVWTPGENVAECRYEQVHGRLHSSLFMSSYTGGVVPLPCTCRTCQLGFSSIYGMPPASILSADPADLTTAKKAPHDVGSLACECGFYAYFDGGDDYHSKASMAVTGIVEGYGHVVAGVRGFRAEKARVLALIKPKRDVLVGQRLWEQVAHNYVDVPAFKTVNQALAEHPLSDPIVTPESTDDFWTRSAS